MMFNPDIKKYAQEVIFSRKTVKHFHHEVFFNEFLVERSVSQKHLGLHLDQKLDFRKHINEKIYKAQKGISVIKNLNICYKLIPLKNYTYDVRSTDSVGTYFCKTNSFKYSFFHYTLRKWNQLDLQLRNTKFLKI